MSQAMRSPDWRALPLAGDGRCLIEASAGTGKTWTIAALYLRLLLECGYTPPQIVVTTFGVAAGQELRERIRARLLDATLLAESMVARGGAPNVAAEGSTDAWLLARWSQDPSTTTGDRNRLRLALAELDMAPITTLHGLCRKLLSDHPFESGSAFGPGDLIANGTLDRELRDDLWRRLAQADVRTLDAGDRIWFASGRPAFEGAIRKVCAPGIGVREVAFDPAALDRIMQPQRAHDLREWIARASFKSARTVMRRGLESLAAFIEAGDAYAPWPEKMGDDLDKPLETQFKPDFLATARAHPVVVFARRALEALSLALAQARAAALARYREQLLSERERRLRERDQLTFDALIERSLLALEGAHGNALGGQLRSAWPIALVDEFQDTDAQQYAILDRIYSDAQGSARGRLVMIGDPKQAIYRFRGGDVDAYLIARDCATDTLRLTVNFRSSPAFVEGCNELFEFAGPVLSQQADSKIRYERAVAGRAAGPGSLSRDGIDCERPLAFHLARTDDGNAQQRRERALAACANQIAGMLQQRHHRIGGRPLEPGDLAVLLPRNDDIARLRALLAEREVPCVGAGTQGVFQTDIARELLVLLFGIENVHDEPAVRAALATRFFLGSDFVALRALLDAPDAWQQRIQQFDGWRDQWRSEGVQAVIQSVTAANARRLANSANSERLLTDLRHLGESLQAASVQCDGPMSLLSWFAQQREGDVGLGEDAAEEQQLRIESDARRVRLMTLHRSKGLQFPVVFLPLMWDVQGKPAKLPLVRDAQTGRRLVDVGGPGFDAAVAEDLQADQDERFRVLYVALTRAQHACHVYASMDETDVPDPKRSALSALLARFRAALGARDVVQACAHIDWSQDDWPWPRTNYLADAQALRVERRALALPASRPYLGRHSFSTLTRRHSGNFNEQAASDEAATDTGLSAVADASDEPVHPEIAALSGLHGTQFGYALHKMFEHRALDRPLRDQLELVRRSLHDAGVALDERNAQVMVRRIAARMQSALDAELFEGDEGSLRLSQLPARQQRAEMDFQFQLDVVSMQRLRAVCDALGEPGLVPPQTRQVLRGLIHGRIDLVFEHDGRFHVLDYKGTFLGERLSDYLGDALREAIDVHAYRFQALIYTIALDRYLRQRMHGYRRDRQLGATVYLFVRAAGLAPRAGVWSHRFDDALIDAVDAVLGNFANRAIA